MITKFTERAWLNPTSWLVSRRLPSLAGAGMRVFHLPVSDDGEYICRLITQGGPSGVCCRFEVLLPNWEPFQPKSQQRTGTDFAAFGADFVCATFAQYRRLPEGEKQQVCSFCRIGSICSIRDLTHREERLETFASSLGGHLEEPRFSWKYAPIRRVLGWQAAHSMCKYCVPAEC